MLNKNLALRHKVVLLFTIMAILIFVFGSISFYFLYNQCLITAYEKLSSTTKQVALVADRYFKSLDSFTLAQFSEPLMHEIITQNSIIKRQEFLNKLNMDNPQLSSEYEQIMLDAAGVLLSSYLFIDRNHFYRYPFSYRRDDAANALIYEKSFDRTSSSPMFFTPTPGMPFCYIVRNVNNIPTVRATGTIIQCVSVVTFDTILHSATTGVDVYITDNNGIIYAHSDWGKLGALDTEAIAYKMNTGTIYESIQSDGTFLMNSEPTAWNRLLVVCSIKKDTVLNGLWHQIRTYLAIALGFLALLGISLYAIASSITRFIKDILSRFSQFHQGDYSVRMPEYNDSDLMLLSKSFNGMACEIQRMIDVVLREELMQKVSELKFLQAQMNPHFLFNILATIRIKAKLSGEDTVYQMLLALGNLMLASISSNNHQLIPLSEELGYIQHYLFLQKIRFEDRLMFEINIEDDVLLSCMIPRLCIESIVENAVTHGIEHKREPGRILVNITRQYNCLLIFIWDNGVGFDVELLEEMKKEDNNDHHSGIGLNNTNRRLKLIYGDESGLTIKSTQENGTSVWIRIPIKGENQCIMS